MLTLSPTASVHQCLEPVGVTSDDHVMDRVDFLQKLRNFSQEFVHIRKARRLIL